MQNQGVLNFANGPTVGILDGGFASPPENADFPPYDGGIEGDNGVITGVGAINPGAAGCSCPWHGTQVVESGFAAANNHYGVAGPGGPAVNHLVLVQSPRWQSLLDDIRFVLVDIPRLFLSSPDILNISASMNVGAVFCLVVCPIVDTVFKAIDEAGTMVVASAGNDGANVDAVDCRLFFCPEADAVLPCEAWGVFCVGGLAYDRRYIDFQSNWGGDPHDNSTVDL
jgi:hypothetical protein